MQIYFFLFILAHYFMFDFNYKEFHARLSTMKVMYKNDHNII